MSDTQESSYSIPSSFNGQDLLAPGKIPPISSAAPTGTTGKYNMAVTW